MKILFVGDASNMHNALATALRRMGHEVTVASNGSYWMDTARDINLCRQPGLAGAVRYLYDVMRALPKMRGYDVVHLVNPIFLELRPAKVRVVFDYLRKHNRSIFLSALGSDYDYVKACIEGKVLKYSEYMIGETPSGYMESPEAETERRYSWLTESMRQHQRYVMQHIDGAVACLYEYYKVCNELIPEKLTYGGIPIDTDSIEARYIETEPEKVRFFIGIQHHRHIFKGTDRLLAAAQRVVAKYPDKCCLEVVENVPYKEYVKRMSQSHVMLDQLYSYTPATNALIAMARGMVAVSGAEPEYYDFIGEHQCQPIVNVSPAVEGDIDSKLEWIVLNKKRLPELSQMSREFVMRHNNYMVVAQRHIDFWNKILKEKYES